MSQLRDLIKIDKRFQNSINLQLDIGKKGKLNSYIPTRSSVKIIGEYLDHVIEDKEKATILIGPYGKGKSHLLLVLLELLSEKKDEEVETIIKRIGKTDKAVEAKIRTIRDQKQRFLPVIISATSGDLNQSFLMGLLDALKREGLEDIAPDSFYSEAVRTIDKWEKEYPDTYVRLEEKLAKYKTNARELRNALGLVRQSSLDLFQKIYPELTAGSVFRPLVQTEAMELYKGFNHVLCEQHGYSGIYIIFDEFSKYIEGHDEDTFANDMAIIQNMCELADGSKNQQIHITFVAHKSIKEYGAQLPKKMINAFVGVEGRLHEVRFIVSAQNNYELVAHAIGKVDKTYQKLVDDNAEIMHDSYELPCFATMFSKADYKKVVAYGCFPLLPLTAYCLLSISEKVAQNERSIFTFLANDERNSLIWIIENQESIPFVAVDAIYDYFQNLFRDNEGQVAIHNEWLKTDYALSKAQSAEEMRVIKAIGILHMIKNQEELPVNDLSIRLASGLNKGKFKQIMDQLVERQLVVYRSKLGVYAFKNNVGVDIDREIKELVVKQPENIDLESQLAKISELEYVLPKQYNMEYTMTRFFRYEYMTAERFLRITDSRYLFEEKNIDGMIIAIVREGECDMESIEKHVQMLADKRVVVICPERTFMQEMNVRRYLAVEKLLADEAFIEQNRVLEQELLLYKEDLIFEINAEIEKIYLPEHHMCKVYHSDGETEKFDTEIQFNRFLSNICASFYEYAPKINNELINRQNISAQIKKARNQIIDNILNESDCTKYEKGTSPEATIYRATMIHTGIVMTDDELATEVEEGCARILTEIDSFVRRCTGEKIAFSQLYETLMGPDYGARKGVLPIFLAGKLAKLEDTPVIYLQDREMEIQAEIFNNINELPQNYYLYVEEQSGQKEAYLLELWKMFLGNSEETPEIAMARVSKGRRITMLVDAMQQWYRSLPQFTLNFRQMSEREQKRISEENFAQLCRFRNLFKYMELNPRDILFERIPEIFGQDYVSCITSIREIKEYLDNHIDERRRDAAKAIKTVFGKKEKESLRATLQEWYDRQSEKARKHLFADSINGFMSCIEQISTNDELVIVTKLSKAVIDIYVDDWNDQSGQQLIDQIRDIKNQIEMIRGEAVKEDGENKISFVDSNGKPVERYYQPDSDDSTSYFLKNAIEDALEEFGDTLETNQKVSVLVQALERLIQQ